MPGHNHLQFKMNHHFTQLCIIFSFPLHFVPSSVCNVSLNNLGLTCRDRTSANYPTFLMKTLPKVSLDMKGPHLKALGLLRMGDLKLVNR